MAFLGKLSVNPNTACLLGLVFLYLILFIFGKLQSYLLNNFIHPSVRPFLLESQVLLRPLFSDA
jgi:hypothetical protein